MGVVHLATDPGGRAVALKVLRAHVANDPEARRRLSREVATLRRVRHPRVAEVLDADVAGAEPYLVTRFVPGRSLEEEVNSSGPLPSGQVARIGRALAEALSAIHAVGVIHRDVKPANVMLIDGDPVLIDFGIAHIADESRITRTGLVMGTPGYLSPELIYGGGVTPATDWWAWGATLVFAATGRQPFGTGPIEAVLERVRRGQPEIDGIESGLKELLAATLTLDPARRPTAAALVQRLDTVISGVTTAPSSVEESADPQGPTSRTPPPDRTRRMPPVTDTPGKGPASPIPPYPGARSARRPPSRPAPGYTPPPVPYTPPPGPNQQQSAPRPPGRGARPPSRQPSGQPARQPARPPVRQTAQQAGRPTAQPTGRPAAQQTGRPVARPPSRQAPPGRSQPQGGYPQEPFHPDRSWADATGARQGTAVLAALALTFAAVAAVAPGGAAVLGFCWAVVARLIQRSRAGLQRRRQDGRPTSGDVAIVLAALPWRLVRSMAMTVVTMILPGLVGVSTSFIAWSLISSSGPGVPSRALALFVAALTAIVTAWWGPGGWSLRTGSRAVVRVVTGGQTGRIVVVAGCLLVVLASAMVASGDVYEPDWAPFPSPAGLLGGSSVLP
ncbi:MAG: hypothetical protein QG622_2420 [Actinomycetota bacterium]|nr:hypothetical protein [Actinomycetota bacterium]